MSASKPRESADLLTSSASKSGLKTKSPQNQRASESERSSTSSGTSGRSSEYLRKYSTRDFSRVSADWVLHCQPWLNEEGALYELQDVSTPPLKDFYMLVVDPYQILFTVWEIKNTSRQSQSHKGATTFQADYETFKTDLEIRGAIQRRTDNNMLAFIDKMISGRINFLDRLPEKVKRRIILYLDVKSVVNMARTAKQYKTLCYEDGVWAKLYAKSDLNKYMTAGLLEINKQEGWKHTYSMASRIKKSVLTGQNAKLPSLPDAPARLPGGSSRKSIAF